MAWTYDALGRVTNRSQTVAGVTKSAGYTYTNGDLTTMTTPSGQSITYGHNSNHQVTSISVNGTTLLSGVTYEPFGAVNAWTWGNGTTATRTYDTDQKIFQISSAGVKGYSYDNAFRITGMTDTSLGQSNWTFGYDLLDRITSGVSSAATRGWTYDANGNRLTETGTNASTYTISPTNNQINSVTGSLTRTYSYDAAGNVLSWTGVTGGYNNRGRLITMTNSSTAETSNFTYNAQGLLIDDNSGSFGTILIWYDEAGHLLGEYNPSGSLNQETIWLGDTPVATLRTSGSSVAIYYVHTNHLNTPLQVTRPSDGIQMWRQPFDPFNVLGQNTNPQGAGVFPYRLRLPGQALESPAGLQPNGFRDYDPFIGRYVESDPIGLRGGINTYAYVRSNPISRRDPLGLLDNPAEVWPLLPPMPPQAWYFSVEGFRANPGQLGAGGGVTWITCYDECGKKQSYRYYKICLSGTSGAGASLGMIAGMEGSKCRKDRYAGYFGELGSSFGSWPLTWGADFGFNNANIPGNNGWPLPGSPSGVSEYGLGLGTPGLKVAGCYYIPF
jgi:RHS repeat-associated protein